MSGLIDTKGKILGTGNPQNAAANANVQPPKTAATTAPTTTQTQSSTQTGMISGNGTAANNTAAAQTNNTLNGNAIEQEGKQPAAVTDGADAKTTTGTDNTGVTSRTAAEAANEKRVELNDTMKNAAANEQTKSFYDRFNEYYLAHGGMSEAEEEKEKKRRKREKIFNAISDGIQSLSNLYFTSKGALSSYNPRNSLSKRAQERWDKIDAQRRADKDREWDNYLKGIGLDNASQLNAANILRAKASAYASQEQGDKYKQDADTNAALGKAKADTEKKRQDLIEAQTNTEKGKPAVQKSQINKNNKQGQAAVTTAHAAVIRANKTGSGSSGKGGKKGNEEDVWNEYNKWKQQYPDEAAEYEKRTGVGQGGTTTGHGLRKKTATGKAQSVQGARNFNAQMRQRHRGNSGGGNNFSVANYKRGSGKGKAPLN